MLESKYRYLWNQQVTLLKDEASGHRLLLKRKYSCNLKGRYKYVNWKKGKKEKLGTESLKMRN